jgi:hypothetical protein
VLPADLSVSAIGQFVHDSDVALSHHITIAADRLRRRQHGDGDAAADVADVALLSA